MLALIAFGWLKTAILGRLTCVEDTINMINHVKIESRLLHKDRRNALSYSRTVLSGELIPNFVIEPLIL
jgi:hypothetical protein